MSLHSGTNAGHNIEQLSNYVAMSKADLASIPQLIQRYANASANRKLIYIEEMSRSQLAPTMVNNLRHFMCTIYLDAYWYSALCSHECSFVFLSVFFISHVNASFFPLPFL